jgi:hypothetical protein
LGGVRVWVTLHGRGAPAAGGGGLLLAPVGAVPAPRGGAHDPTPAETADEVEVRELRRRNKADDAAARRPCHVWPLLRAAPPRGRGRAGRISRLVGLRGAAVARQVLAEGICELLGAKDQTIPIRDDVVPVQA